MRVRNNIGVNIQKASKAMDLTVSAREITDKENKTLGTLIFTNQR